MHVYINTLYIIMLISPPLSSRQINVQLSDVGKIDDSSLVQKKYNRYAIYLLIIAIFYSVPAYQLVITSQRVGLSIIYRIAGIFRGYKFSRNDH